jgi:uncharacterized peroxidase-related enzyme
MIRELKSGEIPESLDDKTQALLRFAEKLALEPGSMQASDVDELRAHGLSDRDITDAVHNVAFFAYINRVALGLGAEPEAFMATGGENIAPGQPLE